MWLEKYSNGDEIPEWIIKQVSRRDDLDKLNNVINIP